MDRCRRWPKVGKKPDRETYIRIGKTIGPTYMYIDRHSINQLISFIELQRIEVVLADTAATGNSYKVERILENKQIIDAMVSARTKILFEAELTPPLF